MMLNGLEKFFLTAMFCGAVYQSNAALSTITVTASVPQQQAGFSDVPVVFQKFDPGQGKLASVEIILQGNSQMTQQYENTADQESSERMRQTVGFTLTLPDGNGQFLSLRQKQNHKYAMDSFDGDIDFKGTSGTTAIYGVQTSKEKVLSSKKRLAMFTGTDLGEMLLSTQSIFRDSQVGASAIVQVQAIAGAEITIVYHFVSVPEPVWYGIMAGGIGVVCASYKIRGQKKRQS